MVLFRTPPFGGKLKLELQRRVPHSRVGVKALADLAAISPSGAGRAETLASVFGFKRNTVLINEDVMDIISNNEQNIAP